MSTMRVNPAASGQLYKTRKRKSVVKVPNWLFNPLTHSKHSGTKKRRSKR